MSRRTPRYAKLGLFGLGCFAIGFAFGSKIFDGNLAQVCSFRDAYAEFLRVASQSGSDKFDTHKYQFAYGKYFAPLQKSKPKLLEIGLGCRMSYGPGRSITTWLKYFGADTEIWVLEFFADCLYTWYKNVTSFAPNVRAFGGNQMNVADLHNLTDTSGGQFDIIIDDGNHASPNQKTTFQTLFPSALKPGGHYFIEDLFCQFLTGIEPGFTSDFGAYKSGDNNTVEEIHLLIDNLLAPWFWPGYIENTTFPLPRKPLVDKDTIESVDCFMRMCVITKKI